MFHVSFLTSYQARQYQGLCKKLINLSDSRLIMHICQNVILITNSAFHVYARNRSRSDV